MISPTQRAKQAAGYAAADLIEDGMLVGLGTGSTAAYFIERLIQRTKEGLSISAIATSQRSEQQAREGGIPIIDINTVTELDITVDGADEIDHQKRMIKGGGGALLREKIVASMSREMVVIVDEKKVVDQLGAFPLPIEVVPFAHPATLHKIQKLGYKGAFRKQENGNFYVTDNGNFIIDIHLGRDSNPEKDNDTLRNIPGVVETGFFFNLAGRVIVGHADGSTNLL